MRVQTTAILLASLLSSCLLAWPARAAEPTAAGLWAQVDDGKVGGWFLIAERNGASGIYDGTIVKTFPKPGDDPNPICTKCPAEEKNAPVLGLTIIKGMQRKALDYENGTILDPRDGTVYRAKMKVSPDGQNLTVRGYVGISLLGRSQNWVRLPDSASAEIDPALLARFQPAPMQPPQAVQARPSQPGTPQRRPPAAPGPAR